MDITNSKVIKEVEKILESGEKGVLMTVVKTEGSTPRKPGAKMIVLENGKTKGTIGGGSLEYFAIKDALDLIKNSEETKICHYDLVQGKKDSTGGICGGEVNIFMEVIERESILYIFGAGHVGQALCKMAKVLDFYVCVIDDRKEFANKESLPEADEIINISFNKFFETRKLRKKDSVVLVTRGYKTDFDCLKHCLKLDLQYLGMLGSLEKVKKTFQIALKEGFTKKDLKKVQSPVGLDIGAHSPAEVAVSILSEMIALKYNKKGGFLSRKLIT